MPTKTISVTAEDIRNGCKNSPGSCPVARGFARSCPRKRIAVYTLNAFILLSTGDALRLPLPQRASDFIIAFDGGKPVKPFKFRLKLP